jgi:hypothetical protein
MIFLAWFLWVVGGAVCGAVFIYGLSRKNKNLSINSIAAFGVIFLLAAAIHKYGV